GLSFSFRLAVIFAVDAPRWLDFNCTCRITPLQWNTTSYPPRSTSARRTSTSRWPRRQSVRNNSATNACSMIFSRKLESDEWAERLSDATASEWVSRWVIKGFQIGRAHV